MSPIAKWGPIFGFEQIVTIIFSAKAKWTCSFLRIASRRFLPRSAPALWKKSCYQKDFAEQEFTFFEALLQNLTSVPPIACSLQWTGTRGPLRQNLWDLNFLPSPLCPSHAPGWFSKKPKFHHTKKHLLSPISPQNSRYINIQYSLSVQIVRLTRVDSFMRTGREDYSQRCQVWRIS